MNYGWGSWHCTGDRDQDHPHGKEMQKKKKKANSYKEKETTAQTLGETFYFSRSSQWSHNLSENTENTWNDKIYSKANNLLHFLGTHTKGFSVLVPYFFSNGFIFLP